MSKSSRNLSATQSEIVIGERIGMLPTAPEVQIDQIEQLQPDSVSSADAEYTVEMPAVTQADGSVAGIPDPLPEAGEGETNINTITVVIDRGAYPATLQETCGDIRLYVVSGSVSPYAPASGKGVSLPTRERSLVGRGNKIFVVARQIDDTYHAVSVGISDLANAVVALRDSSSVSLPVGSLSAAISAASQGKTLSGEDVRRKGFLYRSAQSVPGGR